MSVFLFYFFYYHHYDHSFSTRNKVMKMNDSQSESDDVKVEVVDTDQSEVSKSLNINNGESENFKSKQNFYSKNPLASTYIPSITSSFSNDHITNGLHYATSGNDYRHYDTSPPDIDKAPSFIHRTHSKSTDDQSTTPPSPSSTPPDDKHVWSKSEVELLLDLYEENKEQLKDPRVRKTKIWDDIAKKIRERLDSEVNGCQCNQKFRNLKADFQKVLEHNGRPGNFKRVCKYYDRLTHLLDYTITPNGYRSSRPATYPPQLETTHSPNQEQSESSRHQYHRDYHFENIHSSVQTSYKRKYQENGNFQQNGHLATQQMYMKKPKSGCDCDCNKEIIHLRESIERINNYVVARSAHEEERLRRLEEIHREKLVSITRFMDIFKDYIHKIA